MTYKKYFTVFYLPLFLIFFPVICHAQEEHDDEIHDEISAGGGIAFSTEAPGISPALHFHVIKGLTPNTGIGLGYEAIPGEELHQSVIAFFNYKPHHYIDINFGPGLVLPSHDEGVALTLSAELAVPFHLGEHIHLGPLVDLGWSLHGLHVIGGLHFGIDL